MILGTLLQVEPVFTFETPRIEREWNARGPLPSLAPQARRIVMDGARFAATVLGWHFHFMSIYRTEAEDRALEGHGVHPAWRAADVRTRDRKPSDVAALAAFVNGLWLYDYDRPRMVVCYTAEHGTGPHAHFQTHPHTAPRIPERAS